MAIDKIQSESINLADTFAFTGTVTGAGGVNTPYFSAGSSSYTSVAHNTYTKLAFNSEIYDPQSTYDHSSNYRFTPNVSGKYLIFAHAFMNTGDNFEFFGIRLYKNGSGGFSSFTSNEDHNHVFITSLVTANGSSDYFEIFGMQQGGTTYNMGASEFSAFKIIE
tara:strand:- start:16 stop:507 length:492 start_codon:yes stop_codon:yes gene_type:complete